MTHDSHDLLWFGFLYAVKSTHRMIDKQTEWQNDIMTFTELLPEPKKQKSAPLPLFHGPQNAKICKFVDLGYKLVLPSMI